jgi:hypothetical protein
MLREIAARNWLGRIDYQSESLVRCALRRAFSASAILHTGLRRWSHMARRWMFKPRAVTCVLFVAAGLLITRSETRGDFYYGSDQL